MDSQDHGRKDSKPVRRLVRLSPSQRQTFLEQIKETFFETFPDAEKNYPQFLKLLLQDYISPFAFVENDQKLICMLLLTNGIKLVDRKKFLEILAAKSYNRMTKDAVLDLKYELLYLCEQTGADYVEMTFLKDREGFAELIGLEKVTLWRLRHGR